MIITQLDDDHGRDGPATRAFVLHQEGLWRGEISYSCYRAKISVAGVGVGWNEMSSKPALASQDR